MKIMMVITGMQSGGAERVMATLCNELSINNEIRLLTMKERKTDYKLDDNVEFLAGKIKNKSLIKSVRFVRKQINIWNPEVILSFMTKSNLIALLAKKNAKWETPVIIAERANPNYIGHVLKIIRRFVYPLADGCVFQTRQAQAYYNNILKCNSVVLRNPLNPDFEVQPYHGDRLKKIVSVGRLSVEKNHKLLIDAFSRISDKYIDYSVEIYGDGPLKNELQRYINEKKLQDRVHLMGRKDHIQEYIANAELFVLPSNSEGIPNALLEAMALGMACIATDCPIGGPAAVINDRENGLLLPMNDIERMAEAIELLINNQQLAEHLRIEAEKATQDFDTETVCAAWEAYLKEIVAICGKSC